MNELFQKKKKGHRPPSPSPSPSTSRRKRRSAQQKASFGVILDSSKVSSWISWLNLRTACATELNLPTMKDLCEPHGNLECIFIPRNVVACNGLPLIIIFVGEPRTLSSDYRYDCKKKINSLRYFTVFLDIDLSRFWTTVSNNIGPRYSFYFHSV